MSKKVAFGTTPAKEKPAPTADAWVQSRMQEGSKRLTLDIPKSLHLRLKLHCLHEDITLADLIRHMLEERFQDDRPAKKQA